MSTKSVKTLGWVLSSILALLFLSSAFMKLTQAEAAIAQAASIGISPSVYFIIGVVEILAITFFIIPRTGVLGALMLIAYMGGAIVTHLLNQQSIAMALTVEVAVWIAAALRFPELVQRLFPSLNAVRNTSEIDRLAVK